MSVKKDSRVSYLLWTLTELVSINYLRATYFGLIQSHTSCGSIVWGHPSRASDLFLLQSQVGALPLEHCRPRISYFKILTLINLSMYCITFFYTQTPAYIVKRTIRGNVRER